MSLARRNGRASAVATVTVPVRCAIYTRKSTDEGLDRDFNSLDNQRESAEAFIASQRHEGWTALGDRYDDGGFSGATMERPALKRLLADVEARRIDCVVVYKLDRLSRSLRDYLNLLALFDHHGVGFVAVTQQINTTTPMGRLLLKQLLLFAEFERDMTAERTRDKMHAARRRGKWTGGMPPLGYDVVPEGGKLVVNRDEAEQVRAIFELYVEKGSLIATAEELNRRGLRRKSWTTRDGKPRQGKPWDKVNLKHVLVNPLYAGLQKLGNDTFPGEHPAIVPKALFQRVQRLLAENRTNGGAGIRNGQGFLLRGLIRCAACDTSMVPSWTRKGNRTYRYYTCGKAQKQGHATCPTRSVQADAVENFVTNVIRRIGRSPELQAEVFRQALAQIQANRRGARAEIKRCERDLAGARGEVERLVSTLSRVTGPAADAIAGELSKSQDQVTTLEARLAEVREQEKTLAVQQVEEADLAMALQDFDELWGVLLVAERERILRLLIAGIRYDGSTGKLDIDWRLSGFGELAREAGGG